MVTQKGIFKSSFTGAEAFLADHRVLGKRMMPGMAYIEMTRAAVVKSLSLTEKEEIYLQNVTFLKPIIVEEEKVEIEIHLYPGRGEVGIEVSSVQGIHFQAIASFKNHDSEEKEVSFPKIDIEAIEKQCDQEPVSKDEFYEASRKAGIEFGRSHQGIQKIKTSDEQILVFLSIAHSDKNGMVLDPGMLDSAIQGGAVLSFGKNDGTLKIPFAIKNVEIYGALEEKMVSLLVPTENGTDIQVATESGEVRVKMKGFASREIDLSGNKSELVYMLPQWENKEEENKEEEVCLINNQKNYKNLVKAVFEQAKEWIDQKIQTPHVLEVHLPKNKPEWRGIVGILKAISIENRNIRYRIKQNEELIDLNLQVIDDKENQKSAFQWADNKNVLITGGLGKIGIIVAKDIAKNTQGCKLILTGTSSFDDAKKETLASLEKLGIEAVYHRCDVSKLEETRKLFSAHPKLDIIIHSAGVIHDNFIHNKTVAEIQKVLAPKVQGTKNLDNVSSNLNLDYFITFSSGAGVFGNAGQADYSAANGYMDAFILQRANLVREGKRQGKSISINWPLWAEGGMTVDEENQKQMETLWGFKPLPSEEGMVALKMAMASDQEQIVVVYGKRKTISKRLAKQKAKLEAPESEKEEALSDSDQAKLEKAILKSLTQQTSALLKINTEDLDETAEWQEFGFDSILLTNFANELNQAYSLDLMPTAFFEAPSLETFSSYLAKTYPQNMSSLLGVGRKAPVRKIETEVVDTETNEEKISAFARRFIDEQNAGHRSEDIAVIGISCRFPQAEGLREFWDNLQAGKDCVGEIPAERWDWREYPDARKWGAFIEGIDQFDPLFFGISPAEAIYMSPEQRLLMEYVWKCLEDAGYAGDRSRGTDTGIFVGVAGSEYSYLIDQSGMPIEGYSSTGMVPSVGPNRISYIMDWHGPSEPIETACSSSLVAIHRAVEAIRLDNCDQAIAGGVNLMLTPRAFISFTKAGMLCEDGRCKTFSSAANGYVRGEGVGMIMVKRLDKAIEEGDHIYGIIKGTAENHGGKTNSLTAPNPIAQSRVIQKAIANGGVNANDISYIECHGTGTNLGDPVEINGIKDAFAHLAKDKAKGSCGLGSVKSNMGHLEMAAGIAGIIKVLLQMKHKTLVKSLHAQELNPYLKIEESPFYVLQEKQEWKVEENKRRIAGVSSFGFGGVNAHVIVEEYPQPKREKPEVDEPGIVVLSTKNKEQMQKYVEGFISFLEATPEEEPIFLRDLAYTLQVGREELEERLALVVNDIDELKQNLSDYVQPEKSQALTKLYRGTVKSSQDSKLLIDDTDAGKRYLRDLVTSKDYDKLAELWVRGTKINWDILYQEEEVKEAEEVKA